MKSREREQKIDLARLKYGVGVKRWADGDGDQLRCRADEVLRRPGRISSDLAGSYGDVEVLDVAIQVDELDCVGGSDGGG